MSKLTARRRVAVIVTALASAAAVAFGVQRFAMRDPSFDERALGRILAQVAEEAPLAADLQLPVAPHCVLVKEPHPRLELGKTELRIFGELVQPMPPAGATSLSSSTDLTAAAAWGRATLREAGVEGRTIELAVDGNVRFGVVADAVRAIDDAEMDARPILVKTSTGELGVFESTFPTLVFGHVVIDAWGAHSAPFRDASVPACRCAFGDLGPFARCLEPTPDETEMLRQMVTAFGGSTASVAVDIHPTRDARWGDIIAIIDALAGEGKRFFLGVDPRFDRF